MRFISQYLHAMTGEGDSKRNAVPKEAELKYVLLHEAQKPFLSLTTIFPKG